MRGCDILVAARQSDPSALELVRYGIRRAKASRISPCFLYGWIADKSVISVDGAESYCTSNRREENSDGLDSEVSSRGTMGGLLAAAYLPDCQSPVWSIYTTVLTVAAGGV
jgi:hypothetical protein